MCSCCVLFYCTHLILLKTTYEGVVFLIPGPAKRTVIILQASLRQKCPSFYSGLVKALQMSQKTRTGCATSNTFPSFPQNCFDLKLSFCRGGVILYFLMKSRWVTFKKKEERKKLKIVKERIEWAKCCGRFKTTQQFKPLRNAHCIFTAKYLLCQHLQWKLSFKEDLFRFCFPSVKRTFMLILVFYRH